MKIGEAAAMLGTTPRTLRQWETTGELLPARKTRGGTRYYSITDLMAVSDENAPTIGYARVSGHRQKDDLKRQQEMLGPVDIQIESRYERDETHVIMS